LVTWIASAVQVTPFFNIQVVALSIAVKKYKGVNLESVKSQLRLQIRKLWKKIQNLSSHCKSVLNT